MTVRIVTDSACDLTSAEADRHGIEIVPLSIRFGPDEFEDRTDLSVQAFYDLMASRAELPETAAPSPGRFQNAFRTQIAAGATEVVCINLSSELSATMQSAQAAAAEMTDVPITVFDSRSITAGLGTQVLDAARRAEEGESAEKIVSALEDLRDRTRVVGALGTLDNLKKGGRIGGAQALIGSMLSIKPLIDLSSGRVEELAKARTRRKALIALRDALFEDPDPQHIAVYDAMAPDAGEFLDLISERVDVSAVRTGHIGAVIGTHGGPGVVGCCWVSGR